MRPRRIEGTDLAKEKHTMSPFSQFRQESLQQPELRTGINEFCMRLLRRETFGLDLLRHKVRMLQTPARLLVGHHRLHYNYALPQLHQHIVHVRLAHCSVHSSARRTRDEVSKETQILTWSDYEMSGSL